MAGKFKASDAAEVAAGLQAILDRLDFINGRSGIPHNPENYKGTFYYDEVLMLNKRIQFFKILATETYDEKQAAKQEATSQT